jgi:hypothetical protein
VTHTFTEMDPRVRRRLLLRSVLRIVATSMGLLAVYYAIPVKDLSGASVVLTLVVCLLGFLALVGWQVQAIMSANFPALRAVEAVGAAGPLLIIVFAFVYESVSRTDPAAFSEPLNRTGALYFTVTVLSTVGFGDIVPRSDGARLLVSAQMILDLLLIGVVLRLLVQAARVGRERQQAAQRPATDRLPEPAAGPDADGTPR